MKLPVCVALFGISLGILAEPAPVLVFDESFRTGEMVDGVKSETLPAGWQFHHWSSPDKAEPGGLSKEKFSDPPSSLMIPAVGKGMAGWYSHAQILAKPFRPLTVKGKFLASDDYAGNNPVCFIGWSGHDKKFIKPLFLAMPINGEKGKWQEFAVEIKVDEIPSDAESFTVNVATQEKPGDASPAGTLYFDSIRITIPPQLASSLKLRGDQLANWWTMGQPVVFRAEGQLPDAVTAIRGTVFDSSGREVAGATVSSDKFKSSGWNWQPTEPGFYQIEFAALSANVAEPLVEEFIERAWNTNQIGLFSLPRVCVGILPSFDPARKTADIFGFHVICAPGTMKWLKDTEIRLAKMVGSSFIRFHIQWSELETEKGKFDWEYFDYFVDTCTQAGLQPVICFFSTPRWASRRPDDARFIICVNAFNGYAPKNPADWEDFLTAMVNRYKNRVHTWEVWNEPHLPGFSCYWVDTPEQFVELQTSAYRIIKKLQPDSTIWLGGIGMRYLPFYDAITKQGVGKNFDVLALHGHGVNPHPFYAIDKEYQSPVHPWVDSEWHASLLRFNEPSYKHSERERSLRMVLDWLRQVKLGAKQICFFELMNLCEKESLSFYTAEGMPMNHASGLFRRKPYIQPLFSGIVMSNLTRQFQGEVKLEKEYRFGNQKAVLLSSQAGPLLLFWQETDAKETVDPNLLAAIDKDSSVITWEGKPTNVKAGFELESQTIYLCRTPHIPPSWTAATDVLAMTRKKLEIKGPAGTYATQPLINASGEFLADNAVWNDTGWQKKFKEQPSGDNSARFALSLSGEDINLAVETVDPIHNQPSSGANMWQGDGIEFAFDCVSEGYPEDRAEFQAALTATGPQLFKSKAASLVGDIPTAWSPEGTVVKHGTAAITRIRGDRTLYLVRLKRTELYPMVVKNGDPIRFSLLVNDNNGKTRAGWLNWGSGIVESKDPAIYGTLRMTTKQDKTK